MRSVTPSLTARAGLAGGVGRSFLLYPYCIIPDDAWGRALVLYCEHIALISPPSAIAALAAREPTAHRGLDVLASLEKDGKIRPAAVDQLLGNEDGVQRVADRYRAAAAHFGSSDLPSQRLVDVDPQKLQWPGIRDLLGDATKIGSAQAEVLGEVLAQELVKLDAHRTDRPLTGHFSYAHRLRAPQRAEAVRARVYEIVIGGMLPLPPRDLEWERILSLRESLQAERARIAAFLQKLRGDSDAVVEASEVREMKDVRESVRARLSVWRSKGIVACMNVAAHWTEEKTAAVEGALSASLGEWDGFVHMGRVLVPVAAREAAEATPVFGAVFEYRRRVRRAA